MKGIVVVQHTFLVDAGRWDLQGHWLDREGLPIAIHGKTLVARSQDNWFTMVSKLIFPANSALDSSERPPLTLQYRGRLEQERRYSFILQHSQLGRVEGEGWITPNSIVQRYWVLEDRERRSGFETIHRLSPDQYYLSSGIMAGHHLASTMEATLDREKA